MDARGYVIEAQAGVELLTAMVTVSHGNIFISSGLEGDNKLGMAY